MMREAHCYIPGTAEAEALVLAEPLSFWGGIDAVTGQVIDRFHPDLGACISGRILVMPGGRGSSSASSILAEGLRLGTAPAGIVLAEPDPILTVGALVAQELYGLCCPIVVCPIDGITTGESLRIDAPEGGPATVTRR
jgi:predicted aconitase with swiveling domain